MDDEQQFGPTSGPKQRAHHFLAIDHGIFLLGSSNGRYIQRPASSLEPVPPPHASKS